MVDRRSAADPTSAADTAPLCELLETASSFEPAEDALTVRRANVWQRRALGVRHQHGNVVVVAEDTRNIVFRAVGIDLGAAELCG